MDPPPFLSSWTPRLIQSIAAPPSLPPSQGGPCIWATSVQASPAGMMPNSFTSTSSTAGVAEAGGWGGAWRGLTHTRTHTKTQTHMRAAHAGGPFGPLATSVPSQPITPPPGTSCGN